jgi:hypothetical protein
MQNRRLTTYLAAAALAAAALALGQDPEEMDARDMFFSAADMLRSRKPVAQAGGKAQAGPRPQTPGQKDAGRRPPALAEHRPPPKDAEQYFQTAAQVERPMGLRYSFLQKQGSELVESMPGTVYRSGDLIRLSVMANQKSYLYVVARSTNGQWTPLFPNPKSAQRSNEMVAGRTYQIPGGPNEYFRFDNDTGQERLFILLSKQPVTDMEAMMRGLDRDEQRPVQVIQAENRRNEQVITDLSEGTRGLVFSKISERPEGGDAGEQAVYVVNASSVRADRVVADAKLEHRAL